MMGAMGMHITDISLQGFRSYESFELGELGNLTIFTGRNGVGKTNLLEAIQLMTSASSFRHPQIAQLVREGHDHARVQMESTDGNRQITTMLTLQAGKKRYMVNGKAKAVADVKGMLPAVAFAPDDLQLAKRGSSVRRSALDELGSQLARNYHVVLSDYEKTLRFKNRLLKEEASHDLIAAVNETLITCGSQLFCYRVALFGRMMPLLQRLYAEISNDGEPFCATYVSSWDHLAGGVDAGAESAKAVTAALGGNAVGEPGVGEAIDIRENGAPDREQVRELLAESLNRFGQEEVRRMRSLVGPHNDKITFYLAGRDASAFASQGQQRSIVLAWKLAEVETVRQSLGVNPVLLLDDVMSELDESRRSTLVNFASDDIQTFITATDLSAFNPALLQRARVVNLEG